MPWRKVILIILLFALAALLAGANTWFTAARSTIPLALDTKVLSKEIRREKHEGKDDVCLLELEGLGQIQVDREIYDSVAVGETLEKSGSPASSFTIRKRCNCTGRWIIKGCWRQCQFASVSWRRC
jgi:hypothetical protein